MSIKRHLVAVAGRAGYQIVKSKDRYLKELFSGKSFDTLIDVGANKGQFIELARSSGYGGRIIAFEPLAEHRLDIEKFGNVEVVTSAVGDSIGQLVLNLYSQSDFSSRYELNSNYTARYTPPDLVEKRSVPLTTLDAIDIAGRNVFMKIDTQGSEAAVLRGAESTLQKVSVLMIEVPFLQVYTGGSSVGELFQLAGAAGLFPARFWANSVTDYGAWVDGDVVFVRSPG